ncbi:14308_t:CDS:2, partial [Racocetra persica]
LRICNRIDIVIGSPLALGVFGLILNLFIQIEFNENFRDFWYKVLPNDDQADVDRLIKTSFTKFEFYDAKNSPYWMSPSYERDVFRVNLYRWVYNLGDPYEFFDKFWE